MRRVVLAAALLVPVLVPTGSRAAEPCLVDLEVRNEWAPLSQPGQVAMQDGDPCRLLLVTPDARTRTTDDGGRTWQDVGSAPAPASSLVSANLRAGSALLLDADGRVWRTTDRGRTWSASAGLPAGVTRLVTDEGSPDRVLAVSAPATPALPVALPIGTSGTLSESVDGGRTFSGVDGALRLAITAAAFDAGVPSRWWVGVAGPAGGLFRTDDDGLTFLRTAAGDIKDLATSRLAGGGSEVVAATPDGVLVSRDGGATVVNRLSGTAFSAVRTEWEHPSALMLLAASPVRSSDSGASSRGQGKGLPAACRATDLRRDRSQPSVFLTTCADGTTWRYRSDGTDLTDTDRPDGASTPTLGQIAPQPTPMTVLGKLTLPFAGSRQDGSIAFDGRALYYSDRKEKGVIHRLLASTGAALPELQTTVPRALVHLAYDANRDHLLVLDTAFLVWDVDLRSGRAAKLFHAPLSGRSQEDDEQNTENTFYGAMSYDSATDRLLFANDGSDSFTEFDRAGREQHNCAKLNLQSFVIISGNPAYEASIAGLVATGDGLVYVEAEDDSTVLRIDRSCHVLATFSHERFSEAPAENDAMACDTTTFGQPAVWLRDAREATMTAFSVSSGYCALPSTLTVSAPPGVATGSSGLVCATLRNRARGEPLADQAVDLLVAGRGIGRASTDRAGRACAEYRPLFREAGAGSGSAAARQAVLAAYLGTPAYRPANATASLIVSRAVAGPIPPPPAPGPPVLSNPAPPQLVVAPPPLPPIQPPPAPPQAPQSQPIAQSHPGAQPGAMGALGAAPAPEEEAEAAAQTSDVHQMTGLTDAPWEAYAVPLLLGLAMGESVARRRRASRVRPQW